jgi:putative AlgH/UPF0301 family transcriptional regulator
MDIDTVRQDILKRRENDETYESIGAVHGIGKSMVKYIETHPNYKPSAKVSKSLNLSPSAKLLQTRQAQKELNEIAVYWGYTSWSNYGTQVRKDFAKYFRDGKFQE